MTEPTFSKPAKLHPPVEPIDRLLNPVAHFLHIEAASGVVLLLCTVAALVLANSPWAEPFLNFWNTPVGFNVGDFNFQHPLKHFINDGLMVIFFFVVGLEVKRELVAGELKEFRRALLPVIAALGGMVIPAGIYLALQHGKAGQNGWGIPMATDIAFVVGCLALLGARVPHGLRVLLLSLAIMDDVGAILVIAFGYSHGLNWLWLGAGIGGLVLVWLCNRSGIRNFSVYVVLGIAVWFAFHESGVHATIAGVLLGLMTPVNSYIGEKLSSQILSDADESSESPLNAEKIRRLQWLVRETVSPLEYLVNALHPWVAFGIMPLFALANAGVPLHLSDATSAVSIAVALGLLLGKPIGIVCFSWLFVKLGWANLPTGVDWRIMGGAGFLAGIGFTMALFIAGLALDNPLLDQAKIGILLGSTVSAIVGMIWLRMCPCRNQRIGVNG